MRAAVITALVCLAAGGCSRQTAERGANVTRIEGVSARFEVSTTVRRGESLNLTAVYRNDSTKTVPFRYRVSHIYDSEIWRGDLDKTHCIGVADVPYEEIELKPGEEFRFPDELLIGDCFDVGRYEIRFYYALGLLPDSELRAQYARTYPGRDHAIPWQDHGHQFTVN